MTMVVCPVCGGTGYSKLSATCLCKGRGRCTAQRAKRLCRSCLGSGTDLKYDGNYPCLSCAGFGEAVDKVVPCRTCSGRGKALDRRVPATPNSDARWESSGKPCPECKGTGKLHIQEPLPESERRLSS